VTDCRLLPLVLVELYQLVEELRSSDSAVDERCVTAGMDKEAIRDLQDLYEAYWDYQLAYGLEPLAPPHAQLASWLLAGARHLGPSEPYEAEVMDRVMGRCATDGVDPATRGVKAVLCAWTVGSITTPMANTRWPAIPAFPVDDAHVWAAYVGLLHHLDGLLTDPPPGREELAHSSVVWRLVGISDGLGSLGIDEDESHRQFDNFSRLVAQGRSIVAAATVERFGTAFAELLVDRNALTHLRPWQSYPGFADVVDTYCVLDPVRFIIDAITTFVFNDVTARTEVRPPTAARALSDQIYGEMGWLADFGR